MFCRKCGAKLPDDAEFCTDCGQETVRKKEGDAIPSAGINQGKKKNLNVLHRSPERMKEYRLCMAVLLLIAIAAGGVLIAKGSVCKSAGCDEKAQYGDYCRYHVCMYSGCESKRENGESYCWYHLETTKPKAEEDLSFSSLRLENSYSYTRLEGKLTNYGTATYTFVKVKGAFEDRYGSVIDTDWTYAVGGEGLEPGESVTFHLSVDKNYSIDDCSLSIMDYDYE